MGVWYLFRCNPSIQFIFISAKASSTVVLKEVIGKTTFFLNFCPKMHKLSLNIANKRYVRPPRVMNRKQTSFLAHLAYITCVRGEKVGKNI